MATAPEFAPGQRVIWARTTTSRRGRGVVLGRCEHHPDCPLYRVRRDDGGETLVNPRFMTATEAPHG